MARESADVVLLRPDLEVLCQGVEDGRRTFSNTLKYIGITTSANFGNMVSMALAAPLLPFLPLAAKQILLNNFLSDLPSITIASDQVDADRLATAQHWDVHDLRRYMLVFGLTSTVFDLLTFGLLLKVFEAPEALFQTTWFVVSLLTELVVLLVLRTHHRAWRSRPSTLLWTSTAAVAALALALPYIAPLAGLFGMVRAAAGAAGQRAADRARLWCGHRVREEPLLCEAATAQARADARAAAADPALRHLARSAPSPGGARRLWPNRAFATFPNGSHPWATRSSPKPTARPRRARPHPPA